MVRRLVNVRGNRVVHSLRVSQRLGSKVPMLLKIVTHFDQQLQQLIHLHPIQGWVFTYSMAANTINCML